MKWVDNEDGLGQVAVVQEVIPASPAHVAGILPGDSIGHWGDTHVRDSTVWAEQVAEIGAGDRVNLGIKRADQTLVLPVTITPRPKN